MIKNLKIFTNKKNHKFSLKKGVTFAAMTVLVTLPLAACSKQSNLNTNFNDNDNVYSVTDEYNNSNSKDDGFNDLNSEDVGFEENFEQNYINSFLNSTIVFDNADVENLSNKISSINVDFKYSNFYNLDAAMSKYNNLKEINVTNNNIIKINSNDLFDIVKKNNDEYMKSYKGSKYTPLSDSLLKQICNYLTLSINSEVDSHTNYSDLNEKIQKLKIFNYNDFAYAFYDNNIDILGVSVNSIQTINEENSLERLITHEGKHFMQSIKNDFDGSYTMRYGISYKWDDLAVNSLYNEWFFEASAEQLTINQIGNEGKCLYESGINFLEMIKTSTLLSEKNGINDLEKISLQGDLNNLFDYFGCNTEKEKMEVLKLMFAYNIIITTDPQSSVNEFYDNYNKESGHKLSYIDKLDYSDYLLSPISEVLSKKFYKNLIYSIRNKEITIEELFSIISVFEMQLNKQCRYYESSKTKYLESLYTTYNDIQSELFECISSKLKISKEDIQELYNAYYKNFNTPNIKFMLEDKNSFYSELYNKNKYFRMDSINAYYNKYLSGNNKKY